MPKMTKQQAADYFKGLPSFCKLHPLRKVSIYAYVGEALGLPIPPNCTPQKYVSYYVSDVREAAGMGDDFVPDKDKAFFATEILRLEAEVKRAKKPEVKLFWESQLEDLIEKAEVKGLTRKSTPPAPAAKT